MIDVSPGAAAFHLDGAGDRIDTDALHPRQVNDQAIVTGAQPGATMAPAPHGDQEPMLARELDRGNDVSHVATAGNKARTPINHGIIDFASHLIARIVRLQQFPTQTGLEGVNGGMVIHRVLLVHDPHVRGARRYAGQGAVPSAMYIPCSS